jgi:hypothetical protein
MKQKLIDEQWVDIVQPGIPHGSGLSAWLFGIGLMLITGVAFYFLYYRRPRQRLSRYIRNLYQSAVTSHDQKLILYQLECRLCTYLGIATLAQRDSLSRDWQGLLGSLTHYRYQQLQPTATQTHEVLKQCLSLLNMKSHDHVE